MSTASSSDITRIVQQLKIMNNHLAKIAKELEQLKNWLPTN